MEPDGGRELIWTSCAPIVAALADCRLELCCAVFWAVATQEEKSPAVLRKLGWAFSRSEAVQAILRKQGRARTARPHVDLGRTDRSDPTAVVGQQRRGKREK